MEAILIFLILADVILFTSAIIIGRFSHPLSEFPQEFCLSVSIGLTLMLAAYGLWELSVWIAAVIG